MKPKINNNLGKNKTETMTTKPWDLLCDVVEANPAADVEWKYRYKNGATWQHVTSDLTFAKISGNKLILNGQKVYEVFYKCVGKNRFGEDDFTWQVFNATNFKKDPGKR